MSADPKPAAGAVSGSARADDALRETSAFQRAILECADYAIISTGPDGIIRTFNRAAERMLGYRAEELVGKATPELIHDRAEVARRAAELTEELGRQVPAGFETLVAKTRLGRAYEQEWTYLHKDGRRFPVQLSVTAMRDEAGQIIGFLGIAHDISRRRTAQTRVRQLTENLEQRVRERTAQLGASQHRYETLANTASVGFYHCEPDGRCTFVNQRWCDITGLKPGEALGEGWGRALHPEDYRRVVDEWTRAVKKEQPFQLEYRYRTPAGATVWVYGQAVAERDADGRVVSYVGTVTDITEFKTAQMALSESEQRFRSTFEQAAVGVAHVALDGRWLLVNDWLCNLVGYAREVLMAKTFQDITHPDDLEADLGFIRQMLAGEIPNYGMDKRYFHRDGALVWIRLTVSLVRTADGAPLYFIAIIQDIRARKAAEAALHAAGNELEARVLERTSALARANMLLHTEVEERRRIEAALRDSEARQRTIIDSTPDWIFIKDREFRYRMANAGYAQAFQIRPEDFLGKTDLDLGTPVELVKGDPVKGIRGFWADDREVMDTGQMKVISEEPGMAAGKPLFLSTVKVPLRDAAGEVTGVLGYVRDITERKVMEAELRSREEQLRDLFENATDLIQSVAPDGRLLFVNRAWLNTLGYRISDLATLTIFDIIHPDCLAECRAQFARVMQGEALDNLQAIFRAKDGHKIHVEGNASCRVENGQPVATRAIFRDITARKVVEEERERLIDELQVALAQVKTLSGLLPICGWCKKIRDDTGYWSGVEGYLKKHHEVDFTHGICPECSAKVMADLDKIASPPPPAPPGP